MLRHVLGRHVPEHGLEHMPGHVLEPVPQNRLPEPPSTGLLFVVILRV